MLESKAMNILIVDDEPVQLESLRRGLRTKGFNVLGALSASEALYLRDNADHPIDLVLIDYFMPDLKGTVLLKIIRENNHSLPMIIMTGYTKLKSEIDTLGENCDGYIEKPFNLNLLLGEMTKARLDRMEKNERRWTIDDGKRSNQ